MSVPESLFVPGPVLFQEKDFFLLSVCTGPKKMGYFSNLKNSPRSKGMEDIIARGYSNTGGLSKLTWECKTYKRNDIDTATVSSTLCPLLHFFAGESDAKNALVFHLFLHMAEVDLQTLVIFDNVISLISYCIRYLVYTLCAIKTFIKKSHKYK